MAVGDGMNTLSTFASTRQQTIVTALEHVAPLAGLNHAEYEWLATHGTERCAQANEVLFQEGDPVHGMLILLKGEIQVRRERGGPAALFIGRAGQITGLLPFSRMKHYGGTGYSTAQTWGLEYDRSLFTAMLEAIPSMGQRCVSLLLDRVREVTRMEQQSEKLTALGKLAGNLAHELNNPASAAQRSAAGMLKELRTFGQERFRLGSLCFTPEEIEQLREWEAHVRHATETADQPTSSSVAAREDALQNWLSARGVLTNTRPSQPATQTSEVHAIPPTSPGADSAWQVVPELAEQGITPEHLDALPGFLSPAAASVVLSQLSSALRAERMTGAMLDSTARIFDLIRAIKDYSYMDQAPVQDIDIPQSLENTLAMLQSRLNGIEIRRQYDSDLPLLPGYGSELNQVWTALLENAVDALDGTSQEASEPPCIRISVRERGEFLLVEVEDNGRGIPPELQDRIFEPFFTTKAFGRGLGLGLDTAMRIVRMHRGFLTVESLPGATCFQVRMPIKRLEAY